MNANAENTETAEFDFIIVGSGAGGGPLAARLALNNFRVLLIEAGSNAAEPSAGPEREVSLVPSLHAISTEHPDLSWQFFVNHYDKPPTGLDPKRVQDRAHPGYNKIFYPRAAALGGCTIHNAMITIAGPDSDWDDLADFLGDESWRGPQMRHYFNRLERNEYSDLPTATPATWLGRLWENLWWLFGFELDHTRGKHGFNGWLHTSVTDVSLGLYDKQLVKMLKAALKQSKLAGLERAWTLVRRFVKGQISESLDPNHAGTQAESPEGLALIPLSVCGNRTTIHHNRATPFVMRGRRSSPREFLLEVQASHPKNLTIWTDCLVTKVLFNDGKPPRARGVELLRGQHLYRAHPKPSSEPGKKDEVYVKEGGEVILCGGTFNTPQLLMLSGIGDREQLKKHGIECRVHSPGVGRNLQDRYEVTVISEMKQDFSLLQGATFNLPNDPNQPDPHLKEWRQDGTGLYTSNGAVLGIFKRSRPDLAHPDLFIFGIPAPFKGYELGYSKVGDKHNFFTWTILKAHTSNHDGKVTLSNKDPLDPLAPPEINFHYFNEVTSPNGSGNDPDLVALVEGVKFVRGIAEHAPLWVRNEDHPGFKEVPAGNDEQTKNWIRRVAWGHHACGTCRMGSAGDAQAVLDSEFRVHGEPGERGERRPIDGLRVVDASIFPKIPGYFIVTNIYMASEKAADVITEDAKLRNARRKAAEPKKLEPEDEKYILPDTAVYPRDLRAEEVTALRTRRDQVHPAQNSSGQELRDPVDKSRERLGEWTDDVTGLGLSGGGIRSATLNLGILQALAKSSRLRRVDFLSTASGGGYIGSFLGRFFDRLRVNPLTDAEGKPAQSAPDRIEHELADPDSPAVGWLRKHGNYIAPSGPGDARLNLATFLRNFVSVHLVVGTLIFAFFGLANAVRYGLFDQLAAGLKLALMDKSDLPLGHLLQARLGPFFSPWFVLFELLLLFLVVPRIVGYWIVSQDQHQRFQGPSLTLLFFVGAVLLFVGVRDGLTPEPLVLAFALFSTFIHVEAAWRRGRKREEAVGSGGAAAQRLRTRNYLTYDLSLAFALAGAALGFAFIDTIGHGWQQWHQEKNITYAPAFATIGAAVTALIPITRMAAQLFARSGERPGPPSTLGRIFKKEMMAGLLALVLFTLPLILYSFAAHAVYRGGSALGVGISVTVFALAVSFILAHPKARAFINRSSLAQTYSARLSRAYLGASNPLRHRPEGADITEVMAGDDVPSIRDYRPHAAGGPLHVINVTVNQTVDFTSQRGNRDRKGENIAVSCIGMSVGEKWHSAWADPPEHGLAGPARKRVARLKPLGHVPGSEHPLIDEAGEPTNRAEILPLREWMGISGAAMGPGAGQATQLGTALLMGLANLRTDYWWDSGITEAARDGFPKLTFFRRLLYLIPRVFPMQSQLIFGWIARFSGPWERFWNLSDGGFFDNMAGYELIRRQVPRIILCDGTADPTYEFDDFANLVRKVRIDFDASIEPFTMAELDKHVPPPIREFIGTLNDLKPPTDLKVGNIDNGLAVHLGPISLKPPIGANSGNISGPSKKHAALFWVRHCSRTRQSSEGRSLATSATGTETETERRSVLLYLKATVTGDEDADIEQYHASHPEFPHESTGDQFFDEDQWESYRKLGEHLATPLFKDQTWLWAIPLK